MNNNAKKTVMAAAKLIAEYGRYGAGCDVTKEQKYFGANCVFVAMVAALYVGEEMPEWQKWHSELIGEFSKGK